MRWPLVRLTVAMLTSIWGVAFAADRTLYDFEFANGSAALSGNAIQQVVGVAGLVKKLPTERFEWIFIGHGDSECELSSCPKRQLLQARADKLFSALIEQEFPVHEMRWQSLDSHPENQVSIRVGVAKLAWQTGPARCEAELEVSDSRWPIGVNGLPQWLPVLSGRVAVGAESMLRLPALSGWELVVKQGEIERGPKKDFFLKYFLSDEAQLVHLSAVSNTAVRTVGDLPLEWPALNSDGNPSCAFEIDVQK